MERPPPPRSVVKELLSGVSDVEMRELCVQALRRAYAAREDYQVGINPDLCGYLAGPLAQRKGWTTANNPLGAPEEVVARDPTGVREALLQSIQQPEGSGVFEFLVWFVRAGLAWPVEPGIPYNLRLTQAGHRFLKGSEDHPLLPGFVNRLTARSPGLPEEVVSLMLDSQTCLEHGLMRPAVVLLGVAYEVAVEQVFQSLVSKNSLADAGQKAAARIAAIKGKIDDLMPGSTPQQRDDRFAVRSAYEFADQLRRRRNDASHTAPTYDFEDRQEVEELSVSAGRHLPNLWRMTS